jgi:translation initiation factor 2B subunit (eIF-2B alpha/beta/delta family)
MAKLGVKMGVMMNTMMDDTTSHIAEMMIQGATMGITATTKLIRENENTSRSEEALALARRIIGYEEESIEKLKQFL